MRLEGKKRQTVNKLQCQVFWIEERCAVKWHWNKKNLEVEIKSWRKFTYKEKMRNNWLFFLHNKSN